MAACQAVSPSLMLDVAAHGLPVAGEAVARGALQQQDLDAVGGAAHDIDDDQVAAQTRHRATRPTSGWWR